MGNYGPASLTSVVGKVLETLFRDQMRNINPTSAKRGVMPLLAKKVQVPKGENE